MKCLVAVCLVLVVGGACAATGGDDPPAVAEAGPEAEAIAFEPLFAVAPASEACRPGRYVGSTSAERVHLQCSFIPEASPDVTLAVLVDYPLLDHANGEPVNDRVRAEVARALHDYLDNGVLWASLPMHWNAWVEIRAGASTTSAGGYVVEFAVDAYPPAAANPVHAFHLLSFDPGAGSLACRADYGYGALALEATVPVCPEVRFEPDASDPDVGEWVEARTKFDVANSTFDVRCPGILGGGAYPRSTTFSRGVGDHPFGVERAYIEVAEEAVLELVGESPGPEVVARIDCSGGGSGTSTEVQVFAGDTTEAIRLGRIIESGLFEDRTYGLDGGGFHTKHRVWQEGDHGRSPSAYTIVQHTWVDGDWMDVVAETWERSVPSG